MRRIYVDTCVITAYLATGEFEEPDSRELIGRALEVFSQLDDVELVISDWSTAELAKSLIKSKQMGPALVNRTVNALVRSHEFGETLVEIIPVSPRRGYSFEEFFIEVREKMVNYDPGWGDAMHSVVMRNHGINEILTLDTDDFAKIPGVIVIHPRDVKIPIKPQLKLVSKP